jgi:hypothetical protein
MVRPDWYLIVLVEIQMIIMLIILTKGEIMHRVKIVFVRICAREHVSICF